MLSEKSIRITPDMLNLIAEIDAFKGLWNGLQSHTTALNLIADVASFGKNFESVLGPFSKAPLNPDILMKLSMVVTRSKEGASFKEKHMPLIVQFGHEIIGTLDTAAPEEVESFTAALMQWLDRSLEKGVLHPLLIIAVFTAVFLQICPFEKGNQRMVRLLVTLLMLRCGYAYAPYISMDDIFLDHSHEYFDKLTKLQQSLEDERPDWNPWIEFFLRLIKDHKDKLEGRMDSASQDISNLPTLSAKVMALFQKHERLQMKEIERLTRGRRSTLKLRLAELVEGGYLKRYGQARSTWYSKL